MSRMLGVTPIVLRGEDFSDGLIARRRLYWSNLPLATGIATEFCDGENEGLLSRAPALTPSWSRCRRLRGRLPEDFDYLVVDSASAIMKPVRDNVDLDKRPLGTLLREAGALGNERHDILLAINEDADGDQREERAHVAMSALEVRPCISLPASICLCNCRSQLVTTLYPARPRLRTVSPFDPKQTAMALAPSGDLLNMASAPELTTSRLPSLLLIGAQCSQTR
jgi:hypothetical protein